MVTEGAEDTEKGKRGHEERENGAQGWRGCGDVRETGGLPIYSI